MMEHWTHSGNPEITEQWKLNDDPTIDAYIQPGGCLEFGERYRHDRDIVHICPSMIPAIEEMISRAKEMHRRNA